MRTTATLRILTVAFVLGALGAPAFLTAEEPDPITIAPRNLAGVLGAEDIKKIKARVEYWISELVGAKGIGTVYASRRELLADYEKYSTSEPYKTEFARCTATVVTKAIKGIKETDRLKPQKEVNCALAISRMPQITAMSAMSELVAHDNPSVRFLGWKGFRGIRDISIRTGGGLADMYAALEKHAAAESDALVASVIVDILSVKQSALTSTPFRKAFDRNFAILVKMQETCCSRLASGDTGWVRPCNGALPVLKNAAEFYKPDSKKTTLILQQLINIAYAGAKGFAATKGAGHKAFRCVPLLLEVEPIIRSLSDAKGQDIRGPLMDAEMGDGEKSIAVRRGVLEWVDRLEELGVETPRFKPVKAPTPASAPAPTTKPAAVEAPKTAPKTTE